jgi:CRISPR-associated protein Csb2
MVLRVVGGRSLALESSGLVADTLRRTFMRRCRANVPEWLSGHDAAGAPSRLNRPVYLPLGFVGREHADGHLLGIGIACPSTDFWSDDFQLLQTLVRSHGESEEFAAPGTGFVRLHWGSGNETLLELDERPYSERTLALKPLVWTKASNCWTTVTPIVLPRFPRRGVSPEDVVAQACVSAGYPEPSAVRVQYAPMLAGVPHARSFPSSVRKPGMPPRLRMHAKLWFSQEVRGPMVIGAGRYMGFGFCRPTPESDQ